MVDMMGISRSRGGENGMEPHYYGTELLPGNPSHQGQIGAWNYEIQDDQPRNTQNTRNESQYTKTDCSTPHQHLPFSVCSVSSVVQ